MSPGLPAALSGARDRFREGEVGWGILVPPKEMEVVGQLSGPRLGRLLCAQYLKAAQWCRMEPVSLLLAWEQESGLSSSSFHLSGAGTLGHPQSQVVLVTEGEPVVMECPFHNGSSDSFDEFIWSHRNISRRILQFRMTRPNASCVHRSEGHFSGTVDFARSVSFLNISEVLMNDTGPYHCYVKIGNSNPTEKVTHLLVRGESVSPAFPFLSLQHSTCASLSKRSPLLSSSGFPRPLGSVGQSSGKGPGPVVGKGEWFALQHLALQSSVLRSHWLVQRQQLLWARCFARAGGMQASKQL